MNVQLAQHAGACSSMELGIRFADWCSQHRNGPTWRQIATRWSVDRATAYRWLSALKAARNLDGAHD